MALRFKVLVMELCHPELAEGSLPEAALRCFGSAFLQRRTGCYAQNDSGLSIVERQLWDGG
jgi:hypothetical protein